MSKSKGNVISAEDVLNKYGENAVRFYFLKEGPLDRDEVFNRTQIVDIHNAHVVNEFGMKNLLLLDSQFGTQSFKPEVFAK